MESTFFGLTPEYKKVVLDEIFLLCYHGNGGWTHDEVYNMPIRYRHFYLHKVSEAVERQNEAIEKMNNPTSTSPSPGGKKLKDSPPVPDFVTKASKNKAPKK